MLVLSPLRSKILIENFCWWICDEFVKIHQGVPISLEQEIDIVFIAFRMRLCLIIVEECPNFKRFCCHLQKVIQIAYVCLLVQHSWLFIERRWKETYLFHYAFDQVPLVVKPSPERDQEGADAKGIATLPAFIWYRGCCDNKEGFIRNFILLVLFFHQWLIIPRFRMSSLTPAVNPFSIHTLRLKSHLMAYKYKTNGDWDHRSGPKLWWIFTSHPQMCLALSF